MIRTAARFIATGSMLVAASLAIAAASPSTGRSAGQVAATLQSQLDALRASASLPAVGGALFTSAGVNAIHATGQRQLGQDSSVTTSDLWHIGSISKSFTAALIGIRVDRGELSWDSTLGQVLGSATARKFAGVTLSQLLSHRAGLPANVPAAVAFGNTGPASPLPEQRRRVVESVLSGDPTGAAGEVFLYSNVGFVIAGAILEAHTKRAWEDLIRAEIASALKMMTVGFGPPGEVTALTQPRGHRQQAGGGLLPVEPSPFADNPAFLGPAGTLHMSVADLARWGQEHLRGERGQDGIVRAATMKRMHEPPRPDASYAFGWVVRREPSGRRVIWHNGSNTLWYAIVAFDPDADRGVVIVTNGSIGAAKAVDAAAIAMISK